MDRDMLGKMYHYIELPLYKVREEVDVFSQIYLCQLVPHT